MTDCMPPMSQSGELRVVRTAASWRRKKHKQKEQKQKQKKKKETAHPALG